MQIPSVWTVAKTTVCNLDSGVDKTGGRPWCRPWRTLWPALWPMSGQTFKSIALLQTFQCFPGDCLTNDFLTAVLASTFWSKFLNLASNRIRKSRNRSRLTQLLGKYHNISSRPFQTSAILALSLHSHFCVTDLEWGNIMPFITFLHSSTLLYVTSWQPVWIVKPPF